MGTRVSKGNNKLGKKLCKAKVTLDFQMEMRHEDKTVQESFSMITVSISDFRENRYFGQRFIRVTTTNQTTLFRLAMRLEKNSIVTLEKS